MGGDTSGVNVSRSNFPVFVPAFSIQYLFSSSIISASCTEAINIQILIKKSLFLSSRNELWKKGIETAHIWKNYDHCLWVDELFTSTDFILLNISTVGWVTSGFHREFSQLAKTSHKTPIHQPNKSLLLTRNSHCIKL